MELKDYQILTNSTVIISHLRRISSHRGVNFSSDFAHQMDVCPHCGAPLITELSDATEFCKSCLRPVNTLYMTMETFKDFNKRNLDSPFRQTIITSNRDKVGEFESYVESIKGTSSPKVPIRFQTMLLDKFKDSPDTVKPDDIEQFLIDHQIYSEFKLEIPSLYFIVTGHHYIDISSKLTNTVIDVYREFYNISKTLNVKMPMFKFITRELIWFVVEYGINGATDVDIANIDEFRFGYVKDPYKYNRLKKIFERIKNIYLANNGITAKNH